MSTVIHLDLPLKDKLLKEKISILLANGLKFDPIYSYWLPKKNKREILNSFYFDRLGQELPKTFLVYTTDFNSAAIVSFQTSSKQSLLKTWFCYAKYLPLIKPTCHIKLLYITYILKKNLNFQESYYLESIATNTLSRNQGLASMIIASIETYIEHMSSIIYCETHNGILKNILVNRKWTTNKIYNPLFKKYLINFMIYSKGGHSF